MLSNTEPMKESVKEININKYVIDFYYAKYLSVYVSLRDCTLHNHQ